MKNPRYEISTYLETVPTSAKDLDSLKFERNTALFELGLIYNVDIIDDKTVEIKRMFVKEEYRGTKTASSILKSLENWASEKGFTKCVLETGNRQVEAIKFYKKAGYKSIPNYGQYTHMEDSNCFEKLV